MNINKYRYYLSSIFKLLANFSPKFAILQVFLEKDTVKEWLIYLKEFNLAFYTRGKMDIWSVKETFIDRFYEKQGIHLADGMTVIDIGAGIGEFAIRAASGFPYNRVFALEPYPPSFKLMERNITLNRLENVFAQNCAVSGQDGHIHLDLSPHEPLQFQTTQAPVTNPEEGLQVPATTLDSFFEKNNLDRCDILKLDCEGAEYDILFTCSPAVLERIDAISMEYHEKNGRHRRELVEFLTGRGFKTSVVPNPVHADIGYLYAIKK